MASTQTLTKKLRDGRAARVVRTSACRYRVEIEGELFGTGELVKLPRRSGSATHVISVEGQSAAIGLDAGEARHLGGPYNSYSRPTRCAECGGTLDKFGAIDGLRGINGRCYDCQ